MKNPFKLALVALVITISAFSCGDGDKAKAKPDSLATAPDTTNKIAIDTAKGDTSVKTDSVKKDSVKK